MLACHYLSGGAQVAAADNAVERKSSAVAGRGLTNPLGSRTCNSPLGPGPGGCPKCSIQYFGFGRAEVLAGFGQSASKSVAATPPLR